MERERGRKEVIVDMLEDLSEGEKGDVFSELLVQSDSNRGRMRRISLVDMMENWVS